jgi:putative PIN family toxin of toxin-antitoxin system
LRCVLDTNTVVSALLFPKGRLVWLREAWRSGSIKPLASRSTVDELVRVLAYPKFELTEEDIELILGEYLPFAELRDAPGEPKARLPRCSDANDQMFLVLAHAGRADALVTGDRALLALANETAFAIETPAQFRRRIG